jgi:hypothetical protein
MFESSWGLAKGISGARIFFMAVMLFAIHHNYYKDIIDENGIGLLAPVGLAGVSFLSMIVSPGRYRFWHALPVSEKDIGRALWMRFILAPLVVSSLVTLFSLPAEHVAWDFVLSALAVQTVTIIICVLVFLVTQPWIDDIEIGPLRVDWDARATPAGLTGFLACLVLLGSRGWLRISYISSPDIWPIVAGLALAALVVSISLYVFPAVWLWPLMLPVRAVRALPHHLATPKAPYSPGRLSGWLAWFPIKAWIGLGIFFTICVAFLTFLMSGSEVYHMRYDNEYIYRGAHIVGYNGIRRDEDGEIIFRNFQHLDTALCITLMLSVLTIFSVEQMEGKFPRQLLRCVPVTKTRMAAWCQFAHLFAWTIYATIFTLIVANALHDETYFERVEDAVSIFGYTQIWAISTIALTIPFILIGLFRLIAVLVAGFVSWLLATVIALQLGDVHYLGNQLIGGFAAVMLGWVLTYGTLWYWDVQAKVSKYDIHLFGGSGD